MPMIVFIHAYNRFLFYAYDYLFSAGVYVFRTCVYGLRKTRVYIFSFNRQMCLPISGKDITITIITNDN